MMTSLPRLLEVGHKARVEKGCVAFNLKKGDMVDIVSIKELGAQASFLVEIVIKTPQGSMLKFTTSHPNRLVDRELHLREAQRRIIIHRL